MTEPSVMRLAGVALGILAAASVSACSVKKMAVDAVGGSLADGADVYAADDDPELVREALPFGLKTFETMIDISPENRGLLLGAARGFTAYAFLLEERADIIDVADHAQSRTLRERARRLYLRGRDFALRGLSVGRPDFLKRLRDDPRAALADTGNEDAALLYWAGAAWAAAIGSGNADLGLVAELPAAVALVQRVLEVDEAFDQGAAHELFITIEASRPDGSLSSARAHYLRAVALSGGRRATAHVALAEAVAVREQNLGEFRAQLAAALAIDPDAAPQLRLANVLAQRRARWLESRIPDLFIDADRKETQ